MLSLLAVLALLGFLLLLPLQFASAVSSERIGSRLFVKDYDHDPDGTTAILGAPDAGVTPWSLDMGLGGYDAFGVMVRPTVLSSGAVTKVEIVAADDAALATNLTVVKDSGTVAADALADTVFLECLAEEIRQLSEAGGFNLRYVGVRITASNAGLEANITFIGFGPRFGRTGLTATAIT